MPALSCFVSGRTIRILGACLARRFNIDHERVSTAALGGRGWEKAVGADVVVVAITFEFSTVAEQLAIHGRVRGWPERGKLHVRLGHLRGVRA